MSLLPSNLSQFAEESYWDGFFKARGEKAFDWYGEYPQLSGVIHKYVRPSDKILMVGCGNSKLSEDLYDLSHHNIHNIDISDSVIKLMSRKNAAKRPEMSYTKMDATAMPYEDESFKSAIDKGTLDALLPSTEHKTTAMSMLSEVWRVVKCMGTYMIISLAQDLVIKTVIEAFKDRPCIFRVHQLEQEPDENGDQFMMPVFSFVITKLKPLPGMSPIWETVLQGDKNVRHADSDALLSAVKECQYYAILRHKLARGYQLEEGHQPYVRLFTKEMPDIPRYTMWIVDSNVTAAKRFAVFIVPHGKEKNPAFSTTGGRSGLVTSCGYQRLLVVTLSRGHIYNGLEQVKAELSQKVMQFSPAGTKERSVPFLSVPEGIGIRDVIYHTKSSIRGEISVEDVSNEKSVITRQTFSRSSQEPLASSRVIYKKVRRRSKKKTELVKAIARSELSCNVERCMAALVCHCALLGSSLPNLLLVGLKCGTLASFIAEYILGIAVKSVTCIEEDPVMVTVARDFYELHKDVAVKTARPIKELIKDLTIGDYGCVILNDAHLEVVPQCAPLLNKDGIFIAVAHNELGSLVGTEIKKTFKLCQRLDFEEKCVLVGCNTELQSTEDNYIKITEKVKVRVQADQVACAELANSSDFADSLSRQASKMTLVSGGRNT